MDDMFELSEDNKIYLSNLRSKTQRKINTALLQNTKQALSETKKAESELFSSNTQQFGNEEFATKKKAIYPNTLEDKVLHCNDSPLAHTSARKPQCLDNEGEQFEFDYTTADHIQRLLWKKKLENYITERARDGACSKKCDCKELNHPPYTEKKYVDIMNQIYLSNLEETAKKKTFNLDEKYVKSFKGHITKFNTNENNEILSLSLKTEHNEMVSFEANPAQNKSANDCIIILTKVEEIQNNDSASKLNTLYVNKKFKEPQRERIAMQNIFGSETDISLRNDSSYEDIIDGNEFINNAHSPNYTLTNLSQNQGLNQSLNEIENMENIEKNATTNEYCSEIESDWLIDFRDIIPTNNDGVKNPSSDIECSNKNDREQDLTIVNYENETEIEYETRNKNKKNVVGKEDNNNAQVLDNTTTGVIVNRSDNLLTRNRREIAKFNRVTVKNGTGKNKTQMTPRCNNYLSQNNKNDHMKFNRVKSNKFTKNENHSKQGELNSLNTVIPRYPNYLRHYNDPTFLTNKKVVKSHNEVTDEIIKHPRYPNYLKGHNVTKVNANNQIKKTVKNNCTTSMVLPTNFKNIKQKTNLGMRKSYTDNPIISRSNKILQTKEENAKGIVSNVKKIVLKHTTKTENTKSPVKSEGFCRPDVKKLNTTKQDEIRSFTANNICVQLEVLDKVNATENDVASKEVAAKLVSNSLKKCEELLKVVNVVACDELKSNENCEHCEQIKAKLDSNELKQCEEILKLKNTVTSKGIKSDENYEQGGQNVEQLFSNGLNNNTEIQKLINDAASKDIKSYKNYKHSTQDVVKLIPCSLNNNTKTEIPKLNNEVASKKAKFYEDDGSIEEVVANQLSNGLQENKILAKYKQDSNGLNKIEEIPNEICESASEKIISDENYELSEHTEFKRISNCVKKHVKIPKTINIVGTEEVESHENYNQNEQIAAKLVSDGFNKNGEILKQIDKAEKEKITVKLATNDLKNNEEIPKQINETTSKEFSFEESYEQSKQGSPKLPSNGFKMIEEIPEILKKVPTEDVKSENVRTNNFQENFNTSEYQTTKLKIEKFLNATVNAIQDLRNGGGIPGDKIVEKEITVFKEGMRVKTKTLVTNEYKLVDETNFEQSDVRPKDAQITDPHIIKKILNVHVCTSENAYENVPLRQD